MQNSFKKHPFFRVIASVTITTFAVAGIVSATTTVGTNISTGGTLTVAGASILTGNITAGGTLAVTGATTLTGVLGFGTASSTAGGTDTLKVANINSDTGAISFGDEDLTTTGDLTVGGTFSPAITTVSGTFTVGAEHALDTADAGALNIGTSTATSIEIADTGVMTTVQGTLNVDEAVTLDTTLVVTGATTLTGVLGFGTASSTAGGTDLLKVSQIQSTTGAISFSDENLTTTGTLAAGATTLSSTLAVGGATTLTGATDASTFTQGGGITATSTTNATETLLASDFDVENFIDYTPNLNSTLTLPATSTLSTFIPNAGDMRRVIFRNASSTVAATLTLAAGTGIDLQFVEATGGDLVLNGLDIGEMTFIRETDTDIIALWNEYTVAD